MSAKLEEMLRIAEAATQGPTAMPGEQRVIDDEIYVTMLLAYQQADMDGTMVLASRQAIHETVDALRATKGQLRDALTEVERLKPLCDGYGKLDSDYALMERDLAATKAKLEAAERAIRCALPQAEGCHANHYGDNPEGSAEPEHIRLMRAALTNKETTDAN